MDGWQQFAKDHSLKENDFLVSSITVNHSLKF